MRLVGFVKYIVVVCFAFLMMGNSALSMNVVCQPQKEYKKEKEFLEFHASEFKEKMNSTSLIITDINWYEKFNLKKGRIRRGSVNYLQKGVLVAFECHHNKCETIKYRCDKSVPEIKEFLANSLQPQSVIDTASLEALEEEKQKREELEARLAALEAEKQELQQTAQQPAISDDVQSPMLIAQSNLKDANTAIIFGRVTDNVQVAEVTIDGQPVKLNSDGSFSTEGYIPRAGREAEVIAYDLKGNQSSQTLFLTREETQEATGPVFASLNPSGKRVQSNPDALALIIGVADYENTNAKAIYADKDAQTFYDYALLKLGVPAGNIKELVNDNADEVDVRLAVKDWIARTTKQNRTDVYLFFAGHGLANQSGEDMYILPYDGSPRLLEDSAISRKELFNDIASANPRSVTVFLDTCYSGTTRGPDMLIASRPIVIKAKEQTIPDNFTVFTAAAGDQTANPLQEAEHGMFSYFLMKGMEGDADANNDNEITAGELHAYVTENVIQQSSGSQTPDLQGDVDRVIVQFN